MEAEASRKVCRILWGWRDCRSCGGQACPVAECPWKRLDQAQYFFAVFKKRQGTFKKLETKSAQSPVSIEDFIDVLEKLQSNEDTAKADLRSKLTQPSASVTESPNTGLVLDLALEAILMTRCAPMWHSLDTMELGVQPRLWIESQSVLEYATALFAMPTRTYRGSLTRADLWSASTGSWPTAYALRERVGMSVVATDDIRNHLRIDRRSNTLEIFRHAMYLKEHLRLSIQCKTSTEPLTVNGCLTLPRQLMLEMLYSVQEILFPFDDDKAHVLLKTTCEQRRLDREYCRYELDALRRFDERQIEYIYLADQLQRLRAELEQPRPRGKLEKWLERRSSARYTLLATLIGVIFAVILAIAGLAVSSYQTWITYQAWQHPRQSE